MMFSDIDGYHDVCNVQITICSDRSKFIILQECMLAVHVFRKIIDIISRILIQYTKRGIW
jgi:hypothetical protein